MMKKKLVYWMIIILAFLIQSSVLPVFFASGHVPSLIFMLVLAWSLVDGFENFFWWAIGFGIFVDLTGVSLLGIHVIAFILLIYAASFFSRRFSSGDVRGSGALLSVFFVAIGTIIANIVPLLELLASSEIFSALFAIFFHPINLIIQIVCNSLLFFGCRWFILRIKKFFTLE